MHRHRLLPLLFAAVALFVFRGSILFGRVEIPCNPNRWLPWRTHATPAEIAPPAVNSDAPLAYYPRRVFATERMRSGDLPLWDPTTFAGQPFLANFQSALLYPVNLALYFVDPARAMGWFLFVHLVLAALFFYRCARSFGLAPGPAAAGALLFELNPFFMTRLGHPTFVATAAWLPLAIYAAGRLVRKPGARSTAFLGGVLALAALAGFPQTLIHIGYAVGFFLLSALVLREGPRGRLVLLSAAGALLAACLAAFQLIPTAEFLFHSTRDALDLPSFLSGTHHPAMLARVIVPDFFGNPMRENLWSTVFHTGNGLFHQNYVSTLDYFGVLPLAVGLYGIVRGRRRVFLIGLFVLPLLVLAGTPVANAAFHLPGFRFSRPDRLILLPLFASALGFSFGMERLLRESRRVPRPVAGVLIAFLVLASGAAVFREPLVLAFLGNRAPVSEGVVRLPEPLLLDSLTRTLLASALTTAALAALSLLLLFLRPRLPSRAFVAGAMLLAGADLLVFHERFQLDLPREALFRGAPEIDRIRADLGPYGRLARFGPAASDLLPPATASLYGIHDIGGINAINLERYRRFLEAVEPGLYSYRRYRPFYRPESVVSPLVRLLGARVYAIDEGGKLLPLGGEVPLRRVSLHWTWEVREEDEILRRLRDPAFDPEGFLYVEGDAPSPPSVRGTGSASIERYEPDRVIVRTKADAPAFLLLADAWYPGWRATVDGADAPLYRADYLLRAVHVDAGEHVVDFRYRPGSFRAGVCLSLLALAVSFVLVMKGRTGRNA
jgi:hypothetical protein